MDRAAFDRLTTSCAAVGTRRRLARLVLGLPLLTGLMSLVGHTLDATAADDDHGSAHRRRRRKTRHKHRSNPNKGKRKQQGNGNGNGNGQRGCVPEPATVTCAGKCASVINTCGQRVDCGTCACGSCLECERCDTTSGDCIPNDAVVGQDCGTPGQLCQSDGSCACETTSCPDCQRCDAGSGTCVADAAVDHTCAGPCPSGEWCDAGACAAIAQTVRIPDCGSRCNFGGESATGAVCGQTVVFPSCDLCQEQTGCFAGAFLAEGPLGPGRYCTVTTHPVTNCSSNVDCPSESYCGEFSTFIQCRTICPF